MANYQIIPDFISKEEANELLLFIDVYKDNYDNYNVINTVATNNTWLFNLPSKEELPLLYKIIDRIYNFTNIEKPIQIEGVSTYRFGSGITYMTKSGETYSHLDAIDTSKYPKGYMQRMNILLQSATAGGKFFIEDDSGVEQILEIPELSLILFNSSKYKHGVTKNMGKIPRIIILMDYLYAE